MLARKCVVVAFVVVACLVGLDAQTPQDDEAVWKAFMTWFRTAPAVRGNPVAAYTAVLQKAGTPDGEAKRQAGVLMRQIMSGRSDWIEPFYDMTFSKLLTGDPATDGFTGEPSALLIEAVKGLTPGAALDAGMGQGRNAVYLARQGWKATGFDLSAEAIKSAQSNAAKAGVRIDAVKASYADFDFGVAKWDLIVLTFAWAPMTDEAFVARLRTSLRPNGRIVFEHFLEDQEQPRPPAMQVLKAGQLRELLKGFRLDRYEEITGLADWAGPDTPMVRAVAVKQ
jgi:2-polyprenyl-3-methyl-5-hydroxy-6-metoxy-1,4-benzoquinol methylase